MFCRQCGKPNPDSAQFCTTCGKPLTNPYEPPRTKTGMAGGKPNNYLVWAIFATLCCCLPFGIVSIVYAAQVDTKWYAGDQQGALHSASQARMWFFIALGLGLVVNLFVVAIQILSVAQGIPLD